MKSKLATALSIAMLATMAFALPSFAQRGYHGSRGWGMRARPRMPIHGIQTRGRLTGIRERGFYRHYRTVVSPYWFAPYYYSDYYYPQTPQEAPSSQVVVVERTEQAPAVPPPPPPNALVLERQGNHWVRITDSGTKEIPAEPEQHGAEAKAPNKAIAAPSPRTITNPPARVLPPAVLVFRDGHKEEITRYTIIGDTIYTRANYWNNGSWTRKVPIADLNIPATLELNKARGADFNLPSGPSVIVVRP